MITEQKCLSLFALTNRITVPEIAGSVIFVLSLQQGALLRLLFAVNGIATDLFRMAAKNIFAKNRKRYLTKPK